MELQRAGEEDTFATAGGQGNATFSNAESVDRGNINLFSDEEDTFATAGGQGNATSSNAESVDRGHIGFSNRLEWSQPSYPSVRYSFSFSFLLSIFEFVGAHFSLVLSRQPWGTHSLLLSSAVMMTTEMTETTTDTMATSLAATTAGSDVVLVKAAVVALLAPEAALVAEDEQPRRSGRKREPATMTTTTTTTTKTKARTTVRRTVSELTAVVALPAPARPQSSQGNPFMIYFISKRDKTKAGNPNASFNEIKAIIQKEWCKLPKEERAKYEYGFESVQAEVTTIITDEGSESESGAESTVNDVGNPFTLIEVVRKGDNVSDEEMNACLALVNDNIRVIVLDSQPFSNEQAVSLCEDNAAKFGYQSEHDRATLQHRGVISLINEAEDNPDSSDQVAGNFLGGVLESVKEAFGAEITNSFINLNHGENGVGNVTWHKDNMEEKYGGRIFAHWTQHGEHGIVHLRPVGTDLEFRINIPPGCAVYMSRGILGDDSGNAQFPRFEHKHFKFGARISWVLEIENVDIEAIESSTCSAIMEASHRQDAMRLDLRGIFGGDRWNYSLYTGPASRVAYMKPREYTVLTNASGRIVLFCSRLRRNDAGFERDGVALEDILGQQDGLTVQGIERCSHTGGFVVGVLRVFRFKHFAGLGFTSGQFAALIDADPERKEELANLLTENSNRTASQEVEITQFNEEGIVVGGPSLHDSLRAGKNKPGDKVRIPNLPKSMTQDGKKAINAKMIHASTIASRGEGLTIPKYTRQSEADGHWLIRFTGVTTTQREAIRKGINKRKRS